MVFSVFAKALLVQSTSYLVINASSSNKGLEMVPECFMHGVVIGSKREQQTTPRSETYMYHRAQHHCLVLSSTYWGAAQGSHFSRVVIEVPEMVSVPTMS